MKAKHQSPNTVGKRQTVPIDVNDPRLLNGKIGQTKARIGAEVDIVDAAGNSALLKVGALSAGLPGATLPANDSSAPNINFYQAAAVLKASDTITPPTPIVWDTVNTKWVGTTLHLAWTFNSVDTNNAYAQFIVLTFSNGSLSKTISVTSDQTSYDWTIAENRQMFGLPVTSGLTITAIVQDSFGNYSSQPTAPLVVPAYVSDLPAPVISVSSVKNGYSVSYTTPTQTDFNQIEIQEIVSSASSDPGTGYADVYTGIINPAVVITPDTSKRWVRARFTDNAGSFTSYSTAYSITPTSPVTVNTIVPTEISIGTIAWQGNDIVVPYTLPSTNAGVRFLITLTSTTTPPANGYFYFFPDPALGLNQTHLITSFDLFSAFGRYYDQYSGTFKSYSSTDAVSGGVSISVPKRDNPLALITPNPKVTAIIDGYTVSVSNETAAVAFAEVYESYMDPSAIFTAIGDILDYMDSSYVSGGASGTNTIVTNNWTDDLGQSFNPTPYYGMKITGNGIPDPATYGPTWVTSITTFGSNYTITLNQNLTSQASGSYHMQSLAASGANPLIVYNTDYLLKYVNVVYYDLFNNNSLFSATKQVTPLNPITTLITSAIQIAKTTDPLHPAAIYMSSTNSTDSGSRILMGTSNTEAGIFVWGPNDTNPSTQILGDTSSPLTFTTTNAQIADWLISTDKIESVLGNGITKYTGLSGSNTNYAFWAGATNSKNSDNTAPFSVSPTGAVKASNITITGGSLTIGSGFSVTANTGKLTATGADITGKITANDGSFTGYISMGSSGSIYSGTLDNNGNLITNPGYILNTSGLTFYNGTTNVTTIRSSDGLFTTALANIGGWNIDSSTIKKTSSTGTITLDSSNSLFTVKNTAGTYYSGLSVPFLGNDSKSYVMWAGAYANTVLGVSNANFRVGVDGTLYATGAVFDGSALSDTLTGVGSSISDAASKAAAAKQSADDIKASAHYNAIVSGAAADITSNNTKITGGNIATGAIKSTTYQPPTSTNFDGTVTGSHNYGDIPAGIFSSQGMQIVLDGSGSIISPNFVLDNTGQMFTKNAIHTNSAIYAGSFYIDGYNYWNYNASTNQIGGNNFNAGDGVTNIHFQGSTTQGYGSAQISTITTNAGFYVGSDGLQHPNYGGSQLIQVDSTGMHIRGLQVYGNDYRVSDYYSSGSYQNHAGNVIAGAPFTRSIIYSPMSYVDADGGDGSNVVAGDLSTGFAIYYGKTATGTPNANTGLVGDIFIEV